MPDRAHIQTNAILSDLEVRLNRLYRRTGKRIKAEVDPLLEDIYLDEENVTQRQRLKHAERGGMGNLISAVAVLLVLANGRAADNINRSAKKIYGINFKGMADLFKGATGVNIGSGTAGIGNLLSKYASRAYRRAVGRRHVSDKIFRELKKGIKRGESISRLAKRIDGMTRKYKNSALTTARTETTRIESRARMDAFDRARELGIETDAQWVATSGSRTRDSHAAMGGQIAKADEPFISGHGHELYYPGDPNAPPEETVNCRCVLVPVIRN